PRLEGVGARGGDASPPRRASSPLYCRMARCTLALGALVVLAVGCRDETIPVDGGSSGGASTRGSSSDDDPSATGPGDTGMGTGSSASGRARFVVHEPIW